MEFPVPSHITTERYTKTLKADSLGNFAIYFSPLTGCWEPVLRGNYETGTLPAHSVDSFTWYADNGDGDTIGPDTIEHPINGTTMTLNNTSSWKFNRQGMSQG